MVKNPNKPKAVLWYHTTYICVSTYATYYNLIIFCFFSWQQVNSHKENLAHRDQKEPTGIGHPGIRLGSHLLTCQSLETETSELPHECRRQVTDFILAQKDLFPGIAFNHENNKTRQPEPEDVLGSESLKQNKL